MTHQLTLIQWLSCAIESIASQFVTVDILDRADDLLLTVLESPKLIGDKAVAVRKYVVLGIDKRNGQLSPNDVISKFSDYHNQFGVIELFLISNGQPDEQLKDLLSKLRVHFVKLQGETCEAPSSEVVRSFKNLVLTDVFVEEYTRRLENPEADVERGIQFENPEPDAERALCAFYDVVIDLCVAEQEVLTGLGDRWNFMAGTDGSISGFSGRHAVHRHRLGSEWIDCYFPDRSYLCSAMEASFGTFLGLHQIEDHVDCTNTLSLLREIALQLVHYFASWLAGQQPSFDCRSMLRSIDELRQAPHISLLSRRLVNLQPLEQIDLLRILSKFRARGSSPDIIHLLSRCNWKVQEECLQALRRLGTVHDPGKFQEYVFSPRETIRDAALGLIGEMRGERSADFLIRLYETNQLSLSTSLIQAIGSTRTAKSLMFLISLLSRTWDHLPEAVAAIEETLHYVGPCDLRRFVEQEIDKSRIVSVCEKLLNEADLQPRRVALRLVGALQLRAALPLVENALKSESVPTRLSAIDAASEFHDDETARLVADSLQTRPPDYEKRKLVGFMVEMMERKRAGVSIFDNSRDSNDLDLDSVTARALRKIGTEYALEQANRIMQSSVGRLSEVSHIVSSGAAGQADVLAAAKTLAKTITIYTLPDDIKVWIESRSEQRDDEDIVLATTIHRGGTLDMAMGPRRAILRDIVYPYLRGEKPRTGGPGVVKQGEFKVMDWGRRSDQTSKES